MKIPTRAKNRKAISPVLATVILIAITLIAAIAVAGFVFGLFGTFTKTATVSAVAVSCIGTGGPPFTGMTCTVQLSNTGTSNTATVASASTITFGGNTYTTTLATSTTITGGSTASVALTFAVAPGTSGSRFSGTIPLSNGGSVLFTGSF